MFWSLVLDFTVRRLGYLYLCNLEPLCAPISSLVSCFPFCLYHFHSTNIVLTSVPHYHLFNRFFFSSFYHVYHSNEEYCFLEPDAWIQILAQILPSWQSGS